MKQKLTLVIIAAIILSLLASCAETQTEWDAAQPARQADRSGVEVIEVIEIKGTHYNTELTTLSLSGLTNEDIEPLRHMVNLTTLILTDGLITDLSPISGLTNLTALNLDRNPISDLSPLSGLTNLRELVMRGTLVNDLSPLSGLTNLTALNLNRSPIADLSPLLGLTNLNILCVNYTGVRNLAPLSGLTNLTILHLHDTEVADLTSISGLTNLVILCLHGTNISDVSPLANLSNLTDLCTIDTNVSVVSDDYIADAYYYGNYDYNFRIPRELHDSIIAGGASRDQTGFNGIWPLQGESGVDYDPELGNIAIADGTLIFALYAFDFATFTVNPWGTGPSRIAGYTKVSSPAYLQPGQWATVDTASGYTYLFLMPRSGPVPADYWGWSGFTVGLPRGITVDYCCQRF